MSREISDNDIEKAKELIKEKEQAEKDEKIQVVKDRIINCLANNNFVGAGELAGMYNISIPEDYEKKSAEKIVEYDNHSGYNHCNSKAFRFALSYFKKVGDEKKARLAESLLESTLRIEDANEFAKGMCGN